MEDCKDYSELKHISQGTLYTAHIRLVFSLLKILGKTPTFQTLQIHKKIRQQILTVIKVIQ